jgi:hypothetical protein
MYQRSDLVFGERDFFQPTETHPGKIGNVCFHKCIDENRRLPSPRSSRTHAHSTGESAPSQGKRLEVSRRGSFFFFLHECISQVISKRKVITHCLFFFLFVGGCYLYSDSIKSSFRDRETSESRRNK